MRLQGGMVFIHFVDQKATRVCRGAVADIGMIPWLLTYLRNDPTHNAFKLLLLTSPHCEPSGEREHGALLPAAEIKISDGEL
jgi:hypothetical protein